MDKRTMYECRKDDSKNDNTSNIGKRGPDIEMNLIFRAGEKEEERKVRNLKYNLKQSNMKSNIQKLKFELKRMVVGNLGNTFKKLDKVLDYNGEAVNTFINLQASFKKWESDSIKGIKNSDTANMELAGLTDRLLSFIDSLEEGDVMATHQLREEIYEHILVVCKAEDRKGYFRRFFPEGYFKNVEYTTEALKETAKYDIILFDNYPHDSDEGAHELLQYYLKETSPVVVYFGGYLPLLQQYPEKAYATNSVFSLHARIQEVIEFLKYTRSLESENE